ncbi:unnamed protein product [Anisakis simplex]|uniref:Sidoreflexin n=1 Tax=Anisakis simplex TaxID=6269 RepID=A0A0M3JUE5_ANISI|nr:unnamed protein product [Anisakis simplex]
MTSGNDETIFGYKRYPKFVLNQPKYPQNTFFGRYLHFLEAIDPRTLFTSNKQLEKCVRLLDDYKANGMKSLSSDRELWEAQKIKSAILHPDTGQKILPPFRMSGFVPFGWITVTGMLLPNPSWSTLLFWQWMNQSHNALVNYANRNATLNQPVSTYIKAYCAAVTSACSIAAGLTYLIKRSDKLSLSKRIIIQRFIPLPATSLASSFNVICMRYNEINSGIEVYDENRNVIGISKIAAKQAVISTTLTRAFLPIPLLLAPPCIMPFLERYSFVTRNAVRHLLVNAFVCTLSFAFSLPISLALFPQECAIPVHNLETELQKKTTQTTAYYNRGL